MTPQHHPALYQINTRVVLTRLAQSLKRRATLDDIPDEMLDRLHQKGFDWIWLLSVWQTGPQGQKISRNMPEWRREFMATLPDLCEEDIEGSGFAITDYHVHERLGGDEALERLRRRMEKRGLRLMLDFVPNHTGLDHPWVEQHPEYYVAGSAEAMAREPKNFTCIGMTPGERILAHGRDPFFPGWPDTLQLNYGVRATQDAMRAELRRIAGQCDGVRCDMAMLVLPEVFQRTWGIRADSFWPEAIQQTREISPQFVFMAEVYWDLEWSLQQQGFDYTYDKRLYDRLHEGIARPVREHLWADMAFQNKLARFLENHDEPRAAAVFPGGVYEAAAIITYLVPGLRFFHDGQFEGKRTRISPHLIRGPEEEANEDLARFYEKLMAILRRPEVREGEWRLCDCGPAWAGNESSDGFIAFTWKGPGEQFLLAVVNYSPTQGQCRVRLPFSNLASKQWRFDDQIGSQIYHGDGAELAAKGLFVEFRPWQAAVLTVKSKLG